MYVGLSAMDYPPTVLTCCHQTRFSGHQTAQGQQGRPEPRNGIRLVFVWRNSFCRLVNPCPQHCTRPKGALHGRYAGRGA